MSEAGAAAFLSKSDDSGQMIDTILHLMQAGSEEKPALDPSP